MKILYHHRVASKDGQYVHIAEIIASLKKRGHEVIVCEPASIEKTEFGEGSPFVDRIRAHLPGFIHELAEFLYCLPDYWKLRKLIKRHEPDCIYERYNLFFTSGVIASRLCKLPLLLEVNAPLFEERAKNDTISLSGLARWSQDYVWNNAHFVLPVTEVLAQMVVDRGVARNRIRVIPNGINSEFSTALPPVELVDQKYQLSGKLVLGFTGFVRQWHRLDRVLTVIAQHPDSDWHLLLLGDGPDRARLEEIAQQLGISNKLTVTGIIERKEMPGLVQRFDIALQPDVVAYASPLKMFEYLALGKPILAPDTPNIREILTDRDNALLFDPSGQNFSELLLELCETPQLRDALGASALGTIKSQQLYWDSNADQIVQIFSQLLVKP
ncbi:MAG: glycosyltransferase involved in cell wall biosynthesis [Halioglobus sp.]|jgi:glycosyltransferase involved in cell wall biosynthesis